MDSLFCPFSLIFISGRVLAAQVKLKSFSLCLRATHVTLTSIKFVKLLMWKCYVGEGRFFRPFFL